MLKKLIKYDLIWINKFMMIYFSITLIVSLLNRIMSYFNSLAQEKICDISISFKTREMVIENGINNKSIKLSAQNAKEIKDKHFDNIIKEYYNEDVEIKILPTKNWETLILDIIGE